MVGRWKLPLVKKPSPFRYVAATIDAYNLCILKDSQRSFTDEPLNPLCHCSTLVELYQAFERQGKRSDGPPAAGRNRTFCKSTRYVRSSIQILRIEGFGRPIESVRPARIPDQDFPPILN